MRRSRLRALPLALLLGCVAALAPRLGAAARLPWPATRVFPFAPDVRAIARDADGYMWFAARDGVFRFDGVRLRPLEDANVPVRPRALLVTPEGLWIGGEGQRPLALVRDDRVTAFATTVPATVTDLARGPRGTLLIATTQGLFRYEDAVMERVGDHGPLSAVLTDKRGRVWVGGPAGLARAESASPVWLHRGAVRAVAEDDEGHLWVIAEGIHRFDPGGVRQDLLGDRRPLCFDLLADGPGEVWAACDDRLLRFERGRLAQELPAPPTVDPRLMSIGRDRDGGLWIGARESGLVNLDPDPRLVTIGKPEGLVRNVIFSVNVTPDGAVWIGQGNRVSRWKDQAMQTFSLGGAPRASLVTRDGALWFADTKAGLHRWNGERFESFPAPGVRSLCEDPAGRLFLGLESGGLAERRDGRLHHHPLPFTSTVLTMAPAQGGGLWLGTEGAGLCRWREDGIRCWRGRDGLHDVATSLLNRGERLWIGTRVGIARMVKDQLTVWGPQQGLDLGVIGQILHDGEGHLWLFSARGIARVDERQLDEVADGRRARVSPRLFGLTAGMRSEECTSHYGPTAAQTPDGNVWVATMSGVVIFDPRRLPLAPPPQPLVIETRLNGERVHLRDGAARPVGQGNLQFEYTAPSFTRSHQLAFRYRLLGQDRDWVNAGASTTAHYTNLRPGRYTFEVAAVTPDGERRDRMSLSLTPPFHRTSWFLAVCVAAALALVFAAFRLHGWVLGQRYAAILEERRRIARDLHDTLEQSFVGIRLQLEAAAGDEHVTRAAALVDDTMAEVRASIRALRAPGLQGPDLATALFTSVGQTLAGTPIQLSARTTGTPYRMAPDVERHVLRICQEAVTNALKHAQPRRLELHCHFGDGELRVTVRDDGRGLPPAVAEGRHGLQSMRERTALIRGQLTVGARADGGTEVDLRVPRTA